MLAKQLEIAQTDLTTAQDELEVYLKSQNFDEYVAWMNTVKYDLWLYVFFLADVCVRALARALSGRVAAQAYHHTPSLRQSLPACLNLEHC